MPYKTVESFMNLRKAITLVITGAFLLTSALFAEEINELRVILIANNDLSWQKKIIVLNTFM